MVVVVIDVDVDVNVDINVIVCDSVGVGVDCVDIIVVNGGTVTMVLVSEFPDAKTLNFNARDSVTAKLVKTIEEMPMILT